MSSPAGSTDPSYVRARTDLAAGLAAVRSRAGLSLRQIAARSAKAAEAVPGTVRLAHSTVGDFLKTGMLSVEQLRTFLIVCEVSRADAVAWVTAWHRVNDGPAPAPPVRVIGSIPAPADCFQQRDVADRLSVAAATGGSAVLSQQQVMSGLGGVGKTQLAAAFARTLHASHAVEVLIWIPASTRTTIVTGYARAAQQLELPGVGDDPEQACSGFLSWLGSTDRQWAIVLDDLHEPAHIRGLWPPTSATGRTVVTTRRRDATLLAGRTVIDIDVFTPEEAHAFLAAKLPAELADDPGGVAADLGRLPLALGHAAAYMLDTGMPCSIYRARFADRRARLAELFPDPATLFDDTAATVATTWAMSIGRADQIAPRGVASPLLELASMLDPAGIPAVVFASPAAWIYLAARCHTSGNGDSSTSAAAGGERSSEQIVQPADVAAGLGNLRRFNLINADGDVVSVHALVQRAVRDQLPDAWADAAVLAAAGALNASWPDIERDSGLVALLRANVTALQRHGSDALWSLPSGGHKVLSRAALSLTEAGLLSAAVDAYRVLHERAHNQLGGDHPDSLAARHNLAHLQGKAGDAAGAAEAFNELLDNRLRVLGSDHPHTLLTRGHLARWRGEAGDPAGAAEAFTELLTDQLRILGPDHPQTLATRAHLAALRGEAGDPGGAADAFAELLTDQLRILGPDHPQTLATRHNLAAWRGEAGDPAGAADATAELLTDRLRVLGSDHPDTLNARHNVAYWRGMAGDSAGAVAVAAELLKDLRRVLGPDHPQTLATRHNLAAWRGEAGDPAGAAEAFTELLTDQLRILGPDHPQILTTRVSLGHWRQADGQEGTDSGVHDPGQSRPD